ncbi:MAG TPA: hypothetical protein VGD54_05530, partial [Steroidobacteraceae bacterium]
GDCCLLKRANRNILEQLRPPVDGVVNSGRALVMPIWADSYERASPPALTPDANADREQRDALLWHQDLSRTLDYLESRADIDAQKAGYLGISGGASNIGPIALAIEGRLKTGVLIAAGVEHEPGIHPMIDAVNYAPRIRVPVLMVNGRFDHYYLYAQSQQRLFDLLGTPTNQKSHKVYDVGHFENTRSNSIAMDVSDWFDKYLGVVQLR